MHGRAPRKRKRNEKWSRVAVGERDRLEAPVGSVQLGDLAAVADDDVVALELADQVVGHRLAQVGSPVQKRDERAAAGQPDRGLAGGVAAADHGHPSRTAELRLGRAGCVEDARALVVGEIRRAAAAGTRHRSRGRRRARRSRALLELDDVAPVRRASSPIARYGVAGLAPNFRACVIARPVSSTPVIPAGKPR